MYPFDEARGWLVEKLEGIQQSMCLSFFTSRGIDSLLSSLWFRVYQERKGSPCVWLGGLITDRTS